MTIEQTAFPGLYLCTPGIFEDERGYFFESFNRNSFESQGIRYDWVQDNQVHSQYGVIRGLHYQRPPYAQAKLVRALQGHILDVCVDLRQGSPTYKQAFAIELTDNNRLQLLVPEGFAHGYSVLSATAEVLYKCSNYYHRESDGGFLYNDPALNIDWKIPEAARIISAKDKTQPLLADTDATIFSF
jgi:dTDP-4-dehydrorhamnose 3,5-epimerase